MTLTAVNPADGSQLGRFEELSGDQVTAAISELPLTLKRWAMPTTLARIASVSRFV